MTTQRRLGAKLTAHAREQIADYLEGIQSYHPNLGLLYGIDPSINDGKGSWSMVAYDDNYAAELQDHYGRYGASISFELDGFNVLIPQIGRIHKLDSGVIEMVNNRLIV